MKPEDIVAVNDAIVTAARSKKIGQRALAKAVGLAQSTLSVRLRSNTVDWSADQLAALSKLLGFNPLGPSNAVARIPVGTQVYRVSKSDVPVTGRVHAYTDNGDMQIWVRGWMDDANPATCLDPTEWKVLK